MNKTVQIKAAAGSGKTYALTGEVVELLAGSVSDNGVTAITFTNRAAAEMKERVLARLKGYALGLEKSGLWSREEAGKAVDELIHEALNIRTIDSLIHMLVRVSALELGLPPDFEPVFEQRDIFRPVLEELAEKARDGDADLREDFFAACREVVLSEGKGFLAGDRLEKQVSHVAEWLLLHNGESLASTRAIVDAREELLERCRLGARALRELAEAEELKINRYLKDALDKVAVLDGAKIPAASALAKEGLEQCLNKGSAEPSARARKAYERLSESWQALDQEGAVLKAARACAPYVRLAKRVLEELPERLARGETPHALMPRLANAALSGEFGLSGAMCRLGENIRHLLVDEFQDTSPEQWEALRPLAVEALASGGSLGLVGDEKQAIYGWRGGDSALFDQVFEEDEIRALGPVQRRRLDSNWRSRERVVTWNNAVFGRLGDLDNASDVLAELLPQKASPTLLGRAAGLASKVYAGATQLCKGEAGGLVRLDWVDAEASEDDDEEGRAEMKPGDRRAVALLCSRALELGPPWKDMAVLVRSNHQATWAAEGLMAAGVPVVTSGSLLLCEQPLLRELAAVLRSCADPEDDAAFLAVLSCRKILPQSLEPEWLHNWLARHPRKLCRAFAAEEPAFWERNLAEIYALAQSLGPYDLVQELCRRWELFQRYPGAGFFLERFLEVTCLAEEKGLGDLPAFLRHWQEKGGEEKAPLPDGLNAVRIMTIHKSKGLEFPIVFVPWNDITPKASRDLCRAEAGGLAVLAPWNKGMGAAYEEHMARQALESLNLLYVAWTRARDQLHIFLSTNMKRGGNRAAEALATRCGLLGEMARGDDGSLTLGEIPPRKASEEARSTEISWPLSSAWLPRLKVFRSPLSQLLPESGEDDDQARRRGILAHACLEELAGCPGPRSAYKALAARWALEPDFAGVKDALDWFLSLPEAESWLAGGMPEQSLMDAEGRLHRVDLLCHGPGDFTVLEYKTGAGQGPKPEHERQLRDYLRLLALARPEAARGVLVYLDQRRIFTVEGGQA